MNQRLRFEILERDGFTCRYCGRDHEDGAVLVVDHVLARALGGGDEPENLVAACVDCNSGKSALSIRPNPREQLEQAKRDKGMLLYHLCLEVLGSAECGTVTTGQLLRMLHDHDMVTIHQTMRAVRDEAPGLSGPRPNLVDVLRARLATMPPRVDRA